MKFTVRKASDDYYVREVEINSIDQLIEFRKHVGHDLILHRSYADDAETEWELTIYDDYVE